ncbi:MAG TPA: PEP/pyruvate-binding domain-containing protein [Spirochaetota bacterium]|nr:PEP/pyruvate-binding domain-containing protein [Spirochaetota bacterium]
MSINPLKHVSSGLKGFDKIIESIYLGDNVVWQVDSISDYREFVLPFVDQAYKDNRKIHYMRFADHAPLFADNDPRLEVHHLNAFSGFESFALDVHTIIGEAGLEAFYVFDSLSDLLSAWATDMMIGNFFHITCPYLFELDTVAYFAILRNSHDYKTIARIRETTQLLIDIHNYQGNIYVHPLKVWNRYSPTMFFPHKREGDSFHPLMNTADVADFINHLQKSTTANTGRNLDFWDRLFLEVEELKEKGGTAEELNTMLNRLCHLIIGRDERIIDLARRHFDIDDFISINSRLIGSGFIGGKSAGMLIARKILQNDEHQDWRGIMEPHDSFYVGSDVFYSFIVQNGLWKMFLEHKTGEGYYSMAHEIQQRMITGVFPEAISEQFMQIIEYFGQSPFIVRSSSLLEDTYGHAFAGKYESVFCVNQGSPQERFIQLADAVRHVYASTMNVDALAYRAQRGLDRLDEQMALLVMRVSGTYRGRYFFPDIGGVGLSYNTYVWQKEMDPEAGMVRMVFGLGTRAVDRVEGDYPRIVALDSPSRRSHAGMEDLKRFSQHNADVLNIDRNIIETVPIANLLKDVPDYKIERVGTFDPETAAVISEMGIRNATPWLVSFDPFLTDTDFADTMKKLLVTLRGAYDYHVDIEFTVNFSSAGVYRVNLLQCRPYQAKGVKEEMIIPSDLPDEKVFFRCEGSFLGGSIKQSINRVIYVDPEAYSALNQSGKYEAARIVGRLNAIAGENENINMMLMGPGRWGTSTPSLGVPARFAEINHAKVLVEIASMSDNIMPELSFGSHFFHDLVETGIFYVALFPENSNVFINRGIFSTSKNSLSELIPEAEKFSDVVFVYDIFVENFHIMADIVSQKLVCFNIV